MKRRSLLSAGFVCVFLVLGGLGSNEALRVLQARLVYEEAQQMKAEWEQENERPRDMELNTGFELAYRAVHSEPNNAEYRLMLASLHALRKKGLRLWPREAEAETEKIVENIKAALASRPSWFESWIALALVKFQARQIDHQLQVVLERAIATGKYETSVHHGVSFVGLRVWDALDSGVKEKVVETVLVALENHRVNEFVVKQIVMTDRTSLFRRKLASTNELRALLDKYTNQKEQSL